MTWQWLAEIADRVGRSAPEPWGGSGWRARALKAEAPAKHRALCELVWYLEKEGYAVLHAFDSDHALALAHRAATDQACVALLERAAEAGVIRPLEPDGRARDWDHGWGQLFRVPANSWVDRLNGSIELVLWGNDEWADRPTGKPALAVGASLDPEWYRPLSARTEWPSRLRQLGVAFTPAEDCVLRYAGMPVELLIERGGDTLPEQARYVADWAAPILTRLVSTEFDPGPVVKPPRPRHGESDDG